MYLTLFQLTEPLPKELAEALLKKVSPDRRRIFLRQKGEEAAALRLLPAVYTRAYLAAALGRDNRELQFAVTREQKPYLLGNALFFNFAHTAGAFAFACDRSPVGVDLEKPRRMRRNLIERYYSEGEKAQIEAGADPVLIWTKKEALLKLRGEGLAGILSADTASIQDVFFDSRKVGEYFLTMATKTPEKPEFEILTLEKLVKAALSLEDLEES